MMKKGVTIFLLLTSLVWASETPPSLVKFRINDQDKVQELGDSGMDILYYNAGNGEIEAILTGEQQKNLLQAGYQVEPVIKDLDQYYADLQQDHYFDHFHSIEQIEAYMYDLASTYPEWIKVEDIGDSYNKTVGKGGFDILALKISDNVNIQDPDEAQVLYTAAIHAREIITSEVLIVFIDYLVNNYGIDPQVTNLINNRELWFVPCINPDGKSYVFTGVHEDMYSPDNPISWRKNMRDNNGNGLFDPDVDGVDLNRNFAAFWGIDDLGSKPNYESPMYRGVAPFSEPETQAIRDLVERQDFIISVFYHSYSNLWLYPYTYKAVDPEEPDLTSFRALADSCVAYNGYTPGNVTSGTIYLVNGEADDWLYSEHGIFAFTPEVGTRETGYFWPDTSFIDLLTLENLGPNLYLAWAAGEEPIIQDFTFDNYTNPAVKYTFRVSITAPVQLTGPVALDSSSLTLYYRYGNEGDFASVPLELLPPIHQFIADIPGNDYRGSIQFYVTGNDSLGRRGVWPRGAPERLDSLVIAPQILDNVKEFTPARDYRLLSNYPNPFNGSTVISFTLPVNGTVSLAVYNRLGQKIRDLASGSMSAGDHRIMWDARDNQGRSVPSGVYFYQLDSNGQKNVQKMLYIR